MVNCGHFPCLNALVVIVTLAAALTICIGPYIGLEEWNETLENPRTLYDASISASLLHATSSLPEALLIIGGLSLFLIAIVRQIQLRVIFERNNQYKWYIVIWNVLNAIVLIISSFGLIIASIYKDGSTHVTGAFTAVGTSLFWAFSHSILTFIERCRCGQSEYSSFLTRYVDACLYLCIFIVSLIFWISFAIMYPQGEGLTSITLSDDIETVFGVARADRYIFEWWGFWLLYGIQHGVLIFTFMVNVVDDEIVEFFSKCSCGGKAKSKKTKEEMELYTVYA